MTLVVVKQNFMIIDNILCRVNIYFCSSCLFWFSLILSPIEIKIILLPRVWLFLEFQFWPTKSSQTDEQRFTYYFLKTFQCLSENYTYERHIMSNIQKNINVKDLWSNHHVVPPAWISLTLSRHSSLTFIASGRSSGLHPVYSQSCCM